MIELTFCVPYVSMMELVHKVFQEHPLFERIKKNILQVEVHDVPSLKLKGDVIIARGIAAESIRSLNSGIPLIELPISGYDIVHAIHACRERFGAKKIACIGSSFVMYGVSSIGKAMDVELVAHQVSSEEEGASFVRQAIAGDADAVVGGLMVTKIAEAAHFPAVMIESGYESIRQAVDEAVRTALISRAERARVERLRTIMDYSYEGIIAVDEQGKITLFNKLAGEILKSEKQNLIGSPIGEVLPEIGITRVLETGKEELEGLYNVKDSMISTNCVPLQIDSEIVGAVATFQKISRIQEVEERIRQKLFKKGLTAKYHFKDIIGYGEAISGAIELAMKYSEADSNILLDGETGTGKELFAQSIHNASKRRKGPFVAVNCAAIPEHLLESELFGYVEGAFTGAARAGKAGLFELAHRGTIFLDEVSELSLPFQARLLRVLQEKEIMRLGHDRVIPIDVRVIAASNVPLKDLVRSDRFRRDLLYRLDVLRITIPPLRERKEDIPLLLRNYIEQNSMRMKKQVPDVSPEAMSVLSEHSWPGNVRELINICERLAIIANDGGIDCETVYKVLDTDETQACSDREGDLFYIDTINSESFAKMEKGILVAALRQTMGNKKQAADLLGIDNSTLWRKMRKYNLEAEEVLFRK